MPPVRVGGQIWWLRLLRIFGSARLAIASKNLMDEGITPPPLICQSIVDFIPLLVPTVLSYFQIVCGTSSPKGYYVVLPATGCKLTEQTL